MCKNMALSERAMALKTDLQAVLADKRELEAIEQEWRDLLLFEDVLDELSDGELPMVSELFHERQALRKQLAIHQLKNWAVLQHFTGTGLQRRLLRLRYIRGLPWTAIFETLDFSKQHVMREHNKALESLAKRR